MEKSQENYSKNGMQTRVWGPAGWIFLHCIAQNYPEEPTIEQKEHYRSFFRLVGTVLPCAYCRDSYNEYINLLNKHNKVINRVVKVWTGR